MNAERQLRRALAYLLASQTPLTRKRGRQKLRAATDRLLKDYPLLNGSASPRRTPWCPVCRVPMQSWSILRRHFCSKHGGQNLGIQCVGCKRRFSNWRGLERHLAEHSRDITHFIDAATAAKLGVPANDN